MMAARLPYSKLTCLFCMVAAVMVACGPEPRWSVSVRDQPGALLSVWGTGPRDVWAVGADPRDGSGPMVLHFDGAAWTRVPTAVTGDLWWVFGFAGGPVFAGGEGGMIVRLTTAGAERLPTPGTNVVFGIWGASANDVWAVGGAVNTPTGGFAWRFDGSVWRRAENFPAEIETGATLYKVWGTTASDVWMVGTGGTALRADGARFLPTPSGTTRTLFTVHTAGARAAAVGGFGTGVVLEHDGMEWADVTPTGAPQLAGVALDRDDGYAVGIGGTVYRRTDSGWVADALDLDVSQDLHAAWIDATGGVWAVGGELLSMPMTRGILIRGTKP
jgi:hypothetical protein